MHPPTRTPRLRTTLAAVLLTLACLLTPCAALAAWAVHGLTDTRRHADAMAPLATDPRVRDAVADTVRDAVFAQLGAHPDAVATGAGAPRQTARAFVHDAARSFTRTRAFRAGWDTAHRTVHAALVRALRDPGPRRSRPVTVDLAPVTARVKHQLALDHVPFAHRIPVRHTTVTVLGAAETDRLRKGYRVLDVAARWLPLAAVACALAGITVAACRRHAVTAAGLGTALGGALLGLAVTIGRRLTLSELPGAVHGPAAGAVYDALTAGLRSAAWLLVALGLGTALVSWLTGRLARRRPSVVSSSGEVGELSDRAPRL
ncbi:hypothetical protein AB0E75_24095 [Streptomyces griseoviridis]|uniref:Integral membrane protein n=1 Tax=Streptomyces griseoviridis TaxID=45398 RepID=A0ABT9LH26_STRGD|nr:MULTISPECIES: hypothetical protein [Streptomyces]MDP9683025.1 hypothetical protein [Streptomyces griseoviridis]